jgi:RNA-binding protein 23/39
LLGLLSQIILHVFSVLLWNGTKQFVYCSLSPSCFVVICSLTGGIGATGLNTSMAVPTASVIGAAPAASPFSQPTIPAVGPVSGASVLPVITQSVGMLTEFLLLKNMFDPTMEVIFLCNFYCYFIVHMIIFSVIQSLVLLFNIAIITFLKIYYIHIWNLNDRNMPSFLQTDPDFDLDIKDDVQDECSKFGLVKHIFVDK